MKRNTLALAAGVALALGSSVMITADASFVKNSATLMTQGQTASRWQPDRFGPIVSSDTLWSIAMYYGDKSDLSVYEMMDLFIELNPEAFINGRADRMMDGFYLKVPQVAQQARAQKQATETAASSTPAKQISQPSASSAPAETTSNNAEAAVSFSVEELTRLRDQLAESTALIERLNSENSALQSRLDEVTRELDVLQKKVNAEQVAEDNLQAQIAAEIAATNVTTENDAESKAEAAVVVTSDADEVTTTEQAATTEQADAARIISETEEVAKQSQAAQSADKTPAKTTTKRQKESDFDAFLNWLMQPFQLTLAILIPLLLAAIIWYVLYVRRLNREHLGPYNGALQAAEKDKNEEANQEPQTLSAYEEAEQAAAAEEAADMPEFERIDDAVDLDHQADDVAAPSEAEQLDDELEQLGQDNEENRAESQQSDEEADLDTLLSQSFDDESAETPTEKVADEEPEQEPELEPEFDNSLEFSVEPNTAATEDTDESAVSADQAPASTKPESNDEDMSLDFVIDEPAQSASDDTVELEQFENINLDDLDLEGLTTESSKDDINVESDDTNEGYLEIDDLLADADNADTDFDSPRFEREAGQLDDEETPSGMLDLARAYMELDEYELARAELDKVGQTNDEDAKREAAMLLQKLDEQGH
ncbi:FimV/HubP family polar landmark protein [Pseudidiomarina woesei]|uniref:FimV N-terminal domain n=1 Tax=Pseudidiomarina woesei TaxID=1381080 RepID=A0A0K6GYL3_9GAMM|nr:FimV/HubP family polar landmark protein [Pseudidiomarina woesei]CUA83583.1 FimV N-terminal domain [Pseudidiomarina woesei]